VNDQGKVAEATEHDRKEGVESKMRIDHRSL
jgi:hypothetical protein